MAHLRRKRQKAAIDFGEGRSAEAGSRPKHQTQAAPRCRHGADLVGPFRRKRRQGQGLRLETVEEQPLIELQRLGDLGPVDRPLGIGEFQSPPLKRPGGADDQRARTPRPGGRDRFQGFGKPGMMLRLRVHRRSRRFARRARFRNANVGAADVAEKNRKREVQT